MPSSSSNSNIKRTFGQASRRNGPTRYQRQQGNNNGSGYRSGRSKNSRHQNQNEHSARELTEEQEKAQRRLAQKLKRRKEDEAFDENNGFRRFHRGSLLEVQEGNHSHNDIDNNADNDTDNDRASRSQVDKGGKKGNRKNAMTKRGWVFNLLPTVS